ncbi:MAG TPA: amino acid ABC transporter permease [Mycobacteriales bacterium]|nr:amino acid ABC transporter permease [Mycobacteriales bacterium]
MTEPRSARAIEREEFRRRASVRSTLIACVSTLVVAIVLYFAVTSAPGWPTVRQRFFSPSAAWNAFPSVIDGLWLNIRVMVICEILILILGMVIALIRTSDNPVLFPLRMLAIAYTDLFRGLPLILVLLLLGFGVPGLRLQGLPGNVVIYGGAALVLCYSAYVAEVFRAGIESVHPSQWAAARSLGLSAPASMRYVILPQAVRRVIPPLLNDLVSLQKDSGLISVLGAVDAVQAAQIETGKHFNFTPYVLAGLLFVILTIPMTRLTDHVAARMNRRGR